LRLFLWPVECRERSVERSDELIDVMTLQYQRRPQFQHIIESTVFPDEDLILPHQFYEPFRFLGCGRFCFTVCHELQPSQHAMTADIAN
jgi:hypothetical protein